MADHHEQVAIRCGERSGIWMAVAVHSTALGPALGGCRLWRYAAWDDALADVLALSSAMTLKAAVAGLPLGGGKGVIAVPPGERLGPIERRAVLHDFGDLVEDLGGAYVTAEDVGTASDDMAIVAARTGYVTGLASGRGDPSPFTAQGVEAALRACVASAFGTPTLRGRRVTVVGCGHVGTRLVERLVAAGADVVASDVDPARRRATEAAGAAWVPDPREALVAGTDVLAPCALGGVLDADVIERLDCAVVCGAANNQLAAPELAHALHARGILYAPDFVVNAGGLISVAADRLGGGAEADRRVAGIEQVVEGILEEAHVAAITPVAAALRRAERRLDGAAGVAARAA
jgi:leucine dehydrogenase